MTNKIPRKIYTLIGELIVQFNIMDFKSKHFLSSFIEDERIGYLIASSQSFDFTRKRISSIYDTIIEDGDLITRWHDLQPIITELGSVRNDFAHSIIQFDTVSKDQLQMSRYSERQVLKLSSRSIIYSLDEIRSHISNQKKLNVKLGHLFHSTYMKHNDVIHYSGKGSMF